MQQLQQYTCGMANLTLRERTGIWNVKSGGVLWYNFGQRARSDQQEIKMKATIPVFFRKRLYFWLSAGQQHNFVSYIHIFEVHQDGTTRLETVRLLCKRQTKDGRNKPELHTN